MKYKINALTFKSTVAVLAGLPGMKGLYQPVKVHGLLPYPEATVPIKMHLLEDHEIQ